MININAFIAALKTTWLRKLITNNNRWIVILQSSVSIQNILNLDTSYITENVLPNIKNKFWKDMFLSHVNVSAKCTPTDIQQFQTIPVFFNENIRIRIKTIYSRLSLSRNPRDYETLRDIRTSTYQICGTEENN